MSALGLMAQTSTNVYSLNAVGYINVTLAPGFSIVADQLFATGGNAISNVLNNATGAYDGVGVFKWNGSIFNTDNGDSALSGNADGWDNNGVITINPGEAAWFFNPNSTNITFTFVGTVPQGTNTVTLGTGFSLASSPVPQSGDLVTVMGLTNYNDGDSVYVWNNTTGTGSFSTYGVAKGLGGAGYNGDWNPPGDPIVNVGQGFWYQTTSPISWTRVFSVNQ
jgi:hypothetical protein